VAQHTLSYPKDYRERLPPAERDAKKMKLPVVGGQRPIEWKLGAGRLSDNKQRTTFSGSVRPKDGEEHSYRLGIIRPALIVYPSCRSGIMAPVRYRGVPDGARQRRRRHWF
jgi:hypothetical protein